MYKCETKFTLSQFCDTRYGAHLRWVPDISYPGLFVTLRFVPGVSYPTFRTQRFLRSLGFSTSG